MIKIKEVSLLVRLLLFFKIMFLEYFCTFCHKISTLRVYL